MNVERVLSADLFKTEEFRRSPWVKALCDKAGEIWVTKEPLPPGHFGTYFGATQVRRYDNPYIADLYWLHELTHVVTLTYEPKRSWLQWSRDNIASELEASLASECYAYLRIPGLRRLTFRHEIWVDRFLPQEGSLPQGEVLLSDKGADDEGRIRLERHRALSAPQFNDFLEAQIHNYYKQNHEWCRIWADPAGTGPDKDKPAFRVVEEHMASSDRDATHQDWIKAHTLIGADWKVPFLAQGKAFAEIYRASNAKFGNWLLTR